MAYIIEISEYQRELILKALKAGSAQLKEELKIQSGEWEDSANEELNSIISMTDELPKHNEPGMIHGFSL